MAGGTSYHVSGATSTSMLISPSHMLPRGGNISNLSKGEPMNETDLPAGLVRELRRGQVAVFAGAGASVAAGMPTWLQLVDKLAEDLGMYDSTPTGRLQLSQLTSIPQYYENRFGRKSLTERVRALIPRRGVSPSEVHRLVADLPCDLYYTTNFDILLEDALDARGREFETIATEEDAKDHTSRDRCHIRKIHGSIDIANSLVLTRDDFLRYDARHPHLSERLRTDLATTTFLFLGYSLDDIDFSMLYDRVFLSLAPLERRHYITVFGANPHQVEDLRRRGLEVIDLRYWNTSGHEDGLDAFLQSLCAATSDAVHIRRMFGNPPKGTEIPIVVPSYIHPTEGYEYFPRMDLDVARALEGGASLLGLKTEIFADADVVNDNPEVFLQSDVVMIGSPRGNKLSAFVFDINGQRLQSKNSIYVKFEAGHERTLTVGCRDDERTYSSIDSSTYRGEGDNVEYAVIARYRNPWAQGHYLWLMAGLWGLGTQALADYFKSGGYRSLPWESEGEAVSVLRIRYAQGNVSKGVYHHKDTDLVCTFAGCW